MNSKLQTIDNKTLAEELGKRIHKWAPALHDRYPKITGIETGLIANVVIVLPGSADIPAEGKSGILDMIQDEFGKLTVNVVFRVGSAS